jgi:Zn-dependent protease
MGERTEARGNLPASGRSSQISGVAQKKRAVVNRAAAVPAAPVAPPALPPLTGVIYKINQFRGSFGEKWRDHGASVVWLAWIFKLLRVRVAGSGSVNDPNVESLRPFEVQPAELPEDVWSRMEPVLREWIALGFDGNSIIFHAIVDMFNNSRTFIATLGCPDGWAIARVFLRMEGSRVPPKTHFYSDVLTESEDGTFLWTTGAKATLDEPKQVEVNRIVGAPPAELWAAHEGQLPRFDSVSGIKGAFDREAILCQLDHHHALIRDEHLMRKLFSPLSVQERKTAEILDASYSSAASSGFAYPEVLAEMDRLQNRTSSGVTSLVILGISLLLFLAAGLTRAGAADDQPGSWTGSWQWLALLVPVLLFHELGHYLAMRIFKYRNVRMFFIPFFGAAVSGQHYTAPGWKKAIVALMGPVPGIVLGGLLGILGSIIHNALLMKLALVALFLNGFNLLPILPLDGGRVMQALLFSRHYTLDIIFRVVAGLALIGLGFLGGGAFLRYLGIATLVSIPVAFRLGRIGQNLRRENVVPPPSDDSTIERKTAQIVITKVREEFPKGFRANTKITARNSLSVYEALCTRPPGWLATIGFGILQFGSMAAALVLVIAVMIAQNGGVAGFLRQAVVAPHTPISSQEIEFIPARVEAPPATAPPSGGSTDALTDTSGLPQSTRATVVADFSSIADAKNVYDDSATAVNSDQSLERFGQTILVSVPTSQIAEKRKWVDALQLRTKKVTISQGYFGGAMLTLACVAENEEKAADIQSQLDDYLSLPSQFYLVAPWSPMDTRSAETKAKQEIARRTFLQLLQAGAKSYEDPRNLALAKQIADAGRYGDTAAISQLQLQQQQLFKQIRQDEIQALRDSTDGTVDKQVVDLYLALPKPTTNPNSGMDDGDGELEHYDSPGYQAIARLMGQLPLTNGRPTEKDARYSASLGNVTRSGLLMTIYFPGFGDPSYGGPAVVRWLEDQNCISLKYRFAIDALGLGSPFNN